MALPFTGPCAVGLGIANTYPASPFAKPIANGSSILVIVSTGGGGVAASHDIPTDNYGNTYTLIGSVLQPTRNSRISVYLASDIVGGAGLQVTGSGNPDPSQYGIVAWPLYGTHTYNGDFVSNNGSGSGSATSGTTSGTPAGSIGFGIAATNGGSFCLSPSLAGLKRMLHSEQYDNAQGQDCYTDFVEASGNFEAAWTITGSVIWSACAFSLSGPTASALTSPAGLVQNLFSRANVTTADDDLSEMEAFSPLYGYAGWLSSSQVLVAEQSGTHPWNIRSRLSNFRLDVYLKDAGGATITRTYTVRKNGIDDLLTITVSGVSSADDTLLSGTDLVHNVDLEPQDRVTLHRTGSGGSPEFDVTHWSLDSLNEGNRVSGAAMGNCRTHNGIDYYGAPLTWKNSPTNDNFRQFRADSTGARSLMAFNGRITNYSLAFWQNSNLRTATYPFVWIKGTMGGAGVVQDGSGGTPDTRMSLTGAEIDKNLDIALDFSIGDWLQLAQLTPTGPAFLTEFTVGVAIRSNVDGEYGLSIDWATFLGANGGPVPRYAGVNRSTGLTRAEREALRVGPVTFGRMNMQQLGVISPGVGPGVGNHLFHRLLRNSNTELEIDLTGANTYGVVTGSSPYVQGDSLVFEFVASGAPPEEYFIMGLAMSGAIVISPEQPRPGCPTGLPLAVVAGPPGCPTEV